ncbi:Uncharacterised protein [uncultured Comamonas sp.]|nr:Uncharacterised protein [uncultured Comamonas sp.]
MKFVKIRFDGQTTYKDRTPLKNVWEPGEEKLVSERDAKTLLGYLEFKRVVKSAPEKPTKAEKPGKADGADADELAKAQQAQAEAQALEEKAKKLTENTLMEIEQMDKEQIEAFARANYGVDLDKRRSLDTLRTQVTSLVQG